MGIGKSGSSGGSSGSSEFIIGYSKNGVPLDNAKESVAPFSNDDWSGLFNIRRFAVPFDITIKNMIVDFDTNVGNIVGQTFTLRKRSLAGVWSDTSLTVQSLLNSIAQLEVVSDVNIDKGEAINFECDNLTNFGTVVPESISCKVLKR